MNESNMPAGPAGAEGSEPTPEEIMAALFANLVIQNTNMALMFMGKMAHPQTGQRIRDLESAQMFIDQLEMLAYKTRNNLGHEEDQLLKQSLTQLRLVFVEELRREGIPVPDHLSDAVIAASDAKKESAAAAPTPVPSTPSQSAPTAPAPQAAPTGSAPAPEPEESRKRYSKKY